MKSTAIAHPNIAFTKYWGNKNTELKIPLNSSISMCCGNLHTKTTVEFSKEYANDTVYINGECVEGFKKERVVRHLNRICNKRLKSKVMSENNFPTAAGIASSASAFSALTLAASSALCYGWSNKELSIVSRLESGSASRSIHGGYVELISGKCSRGCYARQIAPPSHFELMDIVTILSDEEKKVSSLEGHLLASTSPYCFLRAEYVEEINKKLAKAITNKDFTTMGVIMESDAVALHAVAMTSNPSIFYWSPKTIEMFKRVKEWRENGIEAYFTVDAGPNVHIITKPRNQKTIEKNLLDANIKFLTSKTGGPASLTKKHLF